MEEAVIAADLVITGEGGLDAQTLEGKAPIGIAKLARKHGRRVIAFAGYVSDDVDWSGIFDAACPIGDGSPSAEESMRQAANLLEQSVLRTAKLMQL